ncbi:methyltransferase domain-containing protein [Winogradskyella forsetii]|uniref:methyltransferase domain-containing protein n=1 Tax=Winogradskyella forsetii TaxID=2686077 RepID=UPI0015B9A5B6|nr:methyltransferase domain-containing protein [Winogradskyella forsetii]
MNEINKIYWENRYAKDQTAWDIGFVSTPLKTYIDQLEDKSLKILIPGAGNSYEAEYLWNNGFKHVYVLDVAKQPLVNLKTRVPDFPEKQLLNVDFFELRDTYDLIIEQTFFCALHPGLREIYVEQMHQLLKPKGKLVGLFFNFELTEDGPPFGGSRAEYQSRFESKFHIKVLEPSINSIKQRQGKELFFIFENA